MNNEAYKTGANALVDRIVDLIPSNPEILEMSSPWDLFKIDGFKCDDIEPSLFQASWSLVRAKQVYRLKNKKMPLPIS